MVMREVAAPRQSYIFARGDFTRPDKAAGVVATRSDLSRDCAGTCQLRPPVKPSDAARPGEVAGPSARIR
jgi:hypothetical protein